MKRIQLIVASFLMMFTIGTASLTVLAPPAAAAGGCATRAFLTFPAWYRGLTDSDCNIVSPSDSSVGGLSNFIWIIVLNVIEILLQVIAYAAALMIIYGGFRFMTSSGNPQGVEQGRKTITNAVIGLIISIASIAIVNLIFGVINGFKP